MQVRIRYADGMCVSAVIITLDCERLAHVAGLQDLIAFRLVQGEWISESGKVAAFEFPDATDAGVADVVALPRRP
jgi:hypothetical protein